MKSVPFALLIPGAYSFQHAPLVLANPNRLSLCATSFSARTSLPFRPQSIVQRFPFSLSMAEEPTDDKVEESATKKEVTPEKIAGRKKRVIAGYKILAASFGVYAAVIAAVSRDPYYGVGPLLASGVSYTLIGAADNSRLSSDTYKRLNIALFEYGLVGFFLSSILGSMYPAVWAATCFIAVVNSIKGYGYGLKGWKLEDACAKEDFISGMKSNLKCITKIPNLKSAGYLAATLLVGTLKLAKLFEVFNLMKNGAGSYAVRTRLFRATKLMMLTIVMFTLKDAADRDRLDGSTFIELNALASVSFAASAACVKITTPLRVTFGLFAAFSAFNGILSTMKKVKKI